MDRLEIRRIINEAFSDDYQHVTKNDVPPTLLRGYTGNKIKIKLTNAVEIPFDAGEWGGGSKSTFVTVEIATGRAITAPKGEVVKLEPGFAVVKHSIFSGKDLGLTIYATSNDMAPLLKKDEDGTLSKKQLIVLDVCKSYKSAYRKDEAQRNGIDPKEYDSIRQSLIDLGLLDTRNAVTLKGKNTPTPRPEYRPYGSPYLTEDASNFSPDNFSFENHKNQATADNLADKLINLGVESNLAYQAAYYSVHRYEFLLMKIRTMVAKAKSSGDFDALNPPREITSEMNKFENLIWREAHLYVANKGGTIKEEMVEEDILKSPTIASATMKDGEINRKKAERILDPKGFFKNAKAPNLK